MNIQELVSVIAKEGGIAKPNKFDVSIFFHLSQNIRDSDLNNYLRQFYTRDNLNNAAQLKFLCDSASIPGVSFSSEEGRTYGPVVKTPYQTTYEDLQLGFICTANMKEKKFFDLWFNAISDPRTNNFNYLEEYCVTIQVKQYNEYAESTYNVKFLDAYPISMQPLELNWSSNDTPHRLNVTFSFKKWITDDSLSGTFIPSTNSVGIYNYDPNAETPVHNNPNILIEGKK